MNSSHVGDSVLSRLKASSHLPEEEEILRLQQRQYLLLAPSEKGIEGLVRDKVEEVTVGLSNQALKQGREC
jgi:hypothetical protein